jgi:oligopeptide/dipeptide ABC transporter ATP-binding protein
MYLGRIIEVAPTEELYAGPRHPYTAGLLAAIPRMTPSNEDEPPAVQGDPPSPLRIPAGCRFRTRCPIAQERCEHDDPELTAAPGRPEHLAACHFPLERAAAAASAGTPTKEESSPSQS